ncbi:hypothetical protein A2773_01470 [Candidatus Gottesmanbacteria bacterium RIFCSPHIGHO2_01_FULL_39_10]|uniref:Uncharacterized protein n=1 Tax=Candidatus Gottesmanbacteria bacterium RIFCSPHIGHO2_01_FULL_39_10 TaxID=1798375 RepID=A0A1F5ZKI4_9BACT|nr:MAG: hypothetical protein A2773_01470 [Candidatus Gottesmanbacteria bacterium RIFCSPHIGHO2_01_FULL_39_10]
MKKLKAFVVKNKVWILIIVVVLIILSETGQEPREYDGMTAEEWADEYYSLGDCVETGINYYSDESTDHLVSYLQTCL